MVNKIYLGFIGLLVINSIQGIKYPDCGLWVENAKIEMRCRCPDDEVPYGFLCRPTDNKCPNGYYDIFEDKCKCIEYKDSDDTNSGCEDLCEHKCENGVCLGNRKCSCNSGYSMSKDNKCEPVCSNGCEHGFCVAPETCKCTEGYSLNSLNECQPICEAGCENGYCMHPNWCSCNEGYLRVGMNKCAPDCPGGCINGYCSEPGVCTCERGYEKSDEGICDICGRGCEDYEY